MHDIPIFTTRRNLLALGLAGLLAGCATSGQPPKPATLSRNDDPLPETPAPVTPAMYAALPDETFPIPAVNIKQVDTRYWRQVVDYPTDEKPGTLIVDTPNKFLYHILPGGKATRYGIGVGRDGFSWAGRAIVAYKRAWPKWTPPDEMVARQPSLQPYSIANGGMPPGLKNPLGARALYIHQGGRDTLYRLHGTPEAFSIGKAVSSGCIRLLNQDVIDLFNNVRDGSTIVVIPDPLKRQQLAA
ncbi:MULTISPECIES: L,D-transpeptidase [Rhizobium/Agrobacterium group]|uniref:L,D-transpeptidase n=1 Tax=Rhizobium/Agrobacterium group TaxID=227290 RepID=UPI002300D982|nr:MULTISPECIES: L,D-transpeptidase [Rhizobium/Agrobacterium group]MDA5634369.1 L,D-transpeptidase [Agrobacterium sp. ST15.16.024]MDF1891201.1 L,D-transpeptidase [Rhizobium rhizogenes]